MTASRRFEGLDLEHVAVARDRYNRARQRHEDRPSTATRDRLGQAWSAYYDLCADLGVRTPPDVHRDPPPLTASTGNPAG